MYHVNDEGNPGWCHAKRQCPFGGIDNHYTSKDAARNAYETRMAAGVLPTAAERAVQIRLAAADTAFGSPAYADHRKISVAIIKLHKKEGEKTAEELRTIQWAVSSDELDAVVKEGKMHQKRLSRLIKADSHKPMAELLSSKNVTSDSPAARLTDRQVLLADAIAHLSGEGKRQLFNLPVSYIKAIETTHAFKNHGTSGIEALVKMAHVVRAQSPSFEPKTGYLPPSRVSGATDPNNIPQMQNVSPQAYELMKRYVEGKYGLSQSRQFWATVYSESSNYPKISDFVRAEKAFDKR